MARYSKNFISLSAFRGKSLKEVTAEPNGSLEQFMIFDVPDNYSVVQGMPMLQPMSRSKKSKETIADLEKFFSKNLKTD